MKKIDVRTLAILSMFVAISVVLARFLGIYLTESIRLSFEFFAIILAGICFGPVAGAVVGGLSDLIGSTLFSGFGFFPPMIVGPILAGFLAGILAKYVFREGPHRWWHFMFIVLTCEILANYLWGSFALSQLTGTPLTALLAFRAPIKLVIMLIDAQLVFLIYRALRPIIKPSGGSAYENYGH